MLEAVHLDTGDSKRAVRRIIHSFFKLFIQALIQGMEIFIDGLGTFSIKNIEDKRSTLYYQYRLVFEPSRQFKQRINRK